MAGVRALLDRLKAPQAVVVTHDHFEWNAMEGILFVALPEFLLAF